MAAASTSGGRTTRRTRGGEGEHVEKVYMTRTRRGRKKADRAAELVDICGSSNDDKEEERGDKLVTVEEKNKLVKLEEEEQVNLEEEEKQVKLEEDEEEEDTWKSGFRTVVDFESDDSLANLTVKTFLRDCYLHPKILCHKQFKFVRDFMGEATGISFQLPVESPYLMDHEDDTICVDKVR